MTAPQIQRRVQAKVAPDALKDGQIVEALGNDLLLAAS